MSEVIKLKCKPQKFSANVDLVYEVENKPEQKTNPVEELNKEFEKRFEEGFNRGYEQAKEDLEQENTNEMLKKSEEFIKILSSLEEKISNYESSFDHIVAEVSLKIAEKVIQSHIPEKESMLALIKSAAQKIIGANEIVIRLNPEDYQLLTPSDYDGLAGNKFTKINFDITQKVERGGCFIETEIGNVDARIDSQLELLRKAFEGKDRDLSGNS
jgi:flagellar assembly protein FliH